MQLMKRIRRSDAGFTLVELMVAIAILGVITVPLANVVIGLLRNTSDTSDRLVLSHDAQISAAYFGADVASVGVRDYSTPPTYGTPMPYQKSVQLNAAYNADGLNCGTSATPNSVVRLLSDDWDTSSSTPTMRTAIVGYYLTATGTVRELHRIKCVGSTTPQSDVVVAHYVDPGSIAVSCSSTCQSTTVPQQITLNFTSTKGAVSAYQITLVGQRRQS